MKLNLSNNSKLQKVSQIDIPDRFYNRMATGIKEIDNLFGSGILPGSTFTLTATPGTGKCHGPNELITIHGDDETIDKIINKLQQQEHVIVNK
jgi:predicted ATP-dependent serine protease